MICDLGSIHITETLAAIQAVTKSIWGDNYNSRVEPFRQYLVDANKARGGSMLATLTDLLNMYGEQMPRNDQMGFIAAYVDEVMR